MKLKYLLFFYHANVGRSETECTINSHLIDQLYNSIDFILQPTVNVVNRMSKLIATESQTPYYKVPYDGAPSSDNTTRQLLWADSFSANSFNEVHSPYGIALSAENGFLQMYAYKASADKIIMSYREIDKNPKVGLPLNYYDNIDQITGKPLGQPDNTTFPVFNTTARPWYINAINNFNRPVWTVYNSLTLGSIAINCARAVSRDITYVSFAEYAFKYFDNYLSKFGGAYSVAYIMNSDSGLLYATSRNIFLNLSQSAISSSDPYISSSSKYIFDNKITSDTDRFVSALGFSIQARFYTSSDPGLKLTLVSTSSEAVLLTESSTENEGKIDIIYDISIAVLVFVFLSFLIFCFVSYNLYCNRNKTSLASRDAKAANSNL